MSFSINNFWESFKSALLYAPVTIQLTAISFIVSLILGTIIATVRNYKIPVLSQFFTVFVTVYLGRD